MESVKKILAYQQTPLVLTCEQSGFIPQDFLLSVTADEREYIDTRMRSNIEPVFFELLPVVSAAGVLPSVAHLLMDVHRDPARARAAIDGIAIPLVEEQGSAEFLLREFATPFREALASVVRKTELRFGHAHVVHLSVLPQFVDETYVDCGIVQLGKPVLDVPEAPEYLNEVYDALWIKQFPQHSWIGIPQRLFATSSLRKEVFETLSGLRAEHLVEQ